ncbi:MAG: DUF2238 domain-containing protein [Firmicutes bacterium]|nr:DUF2238 domain-containing protein [Bacillota bacterium]
MIKKINISLILIAILGSLYFVFTRDNNIVLVLKDISIIITISALYIIQKIFKVKISEGINLIYIIFVFMAHFLGVICELYNYIYWFDKFVHFLSGVVTSFVAIYLLIKFKKDKNMFFDILYIITLTLAIAALWEVFEYLSSYYFNLDPQKVALTGVSDTMGDIIVAFLGSILTSISYYFEIKYNYNLLIKKFIKTI